MLQTTAPRLDPGEQHYWIAGPRARQGQAGCSIAPPPSDRQTNAGPNQHWPKPTLAQTNTGPNQHWPKPTLAQTNTGIDDGVAEHGCSVSAPAPKSE